MFKCSYIASYYKHCLAFHNLNDSILLVKHDYEINQTLVKSCITDTRTPHIL